MFVIAGAFRLLSPRHGLIIVVLLAVPLAEGFRAHPAAASPGFGIILTAVHLAAAAIWVGALLHVIRFAVTLRKQGQPAAPLFAEYARWALALFGLVVVSGTASVVVLGPQDSLRSISGSEGWGRLFLLKLLAVAVIAALAVVGRHTLEGNRRSAGWHPDRHCSRSSSECSAALLAPDDEVLVGDQGREVLRQLRGSELGLQLCDALT